MSVCWHPFNCRLQVIKCHDLRYGSYFLLGNICHLPRIYKPDGHVMQNGYTNNTACSACVSSVSTADSGTSTQHYTDVIMTTMASQITSLTVVYSTVYSDADQRKHQSSASLAFVWGIHRDRWIPRTKGQLRGKCFHLMTSSWTRLFRTNGCDLLVAKIYISASMLVCYNVEW